MWTYGGDPSTSPRDMVRLLIGDTDSNNPLFHDGEINYFLSAHSNNASTAAISAIEAMMARCARMVDESVGSVSIKYGSMYKNYLEMRNALLRRIALGGMTVYAGGISVSNVERVAGDTDRVSPTFTKHLFESGNADNFKRKPDDGS